MLNCTTCGAPIEATDGKSVSACEHCGAQVALPQAATARQDNLAEELQQVEQWWERERSPYMTHDRQGHLHPPEEQNVLYVVFMAVGGVLGLGSAMMGHNYDWDIVGMAGFFLFPILITLPAALLQQKAEKRFKAYKKLEDEYKGRREGVIDRHAQAKK